MVIRKQQANALCDLKIGNDTIERVASYKYLGYQINEEWHLMQEFRCRIELSRSTFQKIRKILSGRDLSMRLRTRVLRCYVFSILLYGVEV